MNIRFNALNSYAGTGKIANVNKKTDSKKASATKSQTVSDSISISAGASDYSEIAKVQTMISSDVNSLGSADRVSAIKSQIAEGSYNVSSEQIAGSILDRFA